MAVDPSKRILLVGASSYDIQSVTNEVAGEVLFPQPASTTDFSVHKVSGSHVEDGEGMQLKLTAAPGFMDHRLDTSPKKIKLVIKNELQNRTYASGFHAVVVVMSYPFRWTDEERNTIKFTKDVIREGNISKYGTLVLANGQNFKRKYPENTIEKFQEYLENQASQVEELKYFLNLFNGRTLILDTELQDQALNGPQLQQFFGGIRNDIFTFHEMQDIRRDENDGCCSVL